MPIASTHRKQRQKNLVLLAILLVIIASIFYLTMIRIAAFGHLPKAPTTLDLSPSATQSDAASTLEK